MLKNSNKSKIGRNEPCPCGSGKKFKSCCMGSEKSSFDVNKELYLRKYDIKLKEKKDITAIKDCGSLLLEIMDKVEIMIVPGIKTDDINTVVHEEILKAGAIPATLNYRGYPKSVCVSVNEVICHGIPGERILKEGDIVNVDITPILNGYFADANRTFFVGKPSNDAKKIVSVAYESFMLGMEAVKPGNPINEIGRAIQKCAESSGCSVVREFVGHGVGFDFHEAPQVLHFYRKNDNVILTPGMVFTIEPMINLGGNDLDILQDNWTAVTMDGSLSAQFEQTVLVTETGYESLTPFTFAP